MATKLQHFSHDHELMLINEVHKDDEEIKSCYGCGKPVLEEESAFRCTYDGCKFSLHKRCAELPKEIKHPMHSDHPLTLLVHRSCICNSCTLPWNLFTYNCKLCKFDICISCVLEEDERVIEHKGHNHPLTLLKSSASFRCDACRTEAKDLSYLCTTCLFWIHKTCAFSPNTIQHPNHDHPLNLAYSFPYQFRSFTYYCDICGKQVHPSYWIYCCTDCRYFAHVKCTHMPSIGNGSEIKAMRKSIPVSVTGEGVVVTASDVSGVITSGIGHQTVAQELGGCESCAMSVLGSEGGRGISVNISEGVTKTTASDDFVGGSDVCANVSGELPSWLSDAGLFIEGDVPTIVENIPAQTEVCRFSSVTVAKYPFLSGVELISSSFVLISRVLARYPETFTSFSPKNVAFRTILLEHLAAGMKEFGLCRVPLSQEDNIRTQDFLTDVKSVGFDVLWLGKIFARVVSVQGSPSFRQWFDSVRISVKVVDQAKVLREEVNHLKEKLDKLQKEFVTKEAVLTVVELRRQDAEASGLSAQQSLEATFGIGVLDLVRKDIGESFFI